MIVIRKERINARMIKSLVCGLILILGTAFGIVEQSHAQEPGHRIIIKNQSGQFALIKVVGPTKAAAKIPNEQKRTVRVVQGDYYILVRYGFTPKEFIYTKGDTFTVTQVGEKYSITTITLHRLVAGIKNPHEVSEEEFENFTIMKE